MSVSDYLTPGKDISFEVEIDGKKSLYSSTVEVIEGQIFSIRVLDKMFGNKKVFAGMDALVIGQNRGLKFSLPVEIESLQNLPVIKLKHIRARTHVRIDGFIRLKYTKITKEQFLKKRIPYIQNSETEGVAKHSIPSNYFDEGNQKQTSSLPTEIIDEIHSIHKKLDLILKLMGNSEENDIFKEKPTEVNISGAGFKFKSYADLQIGDFLDLKMVLPNQSCLVIEAVGEVVRIDRVSRKEEGADGGACKEVAVKFAAINEDNREAIIRYVFKRQRELLRAKEEI